MLQSEVMLKLVLIGLCCALVYAQVCDYGGQEYQTGDSFPAIDGCNKCSCHMGAVACTFMCMPTAGPCTYNGTVYQTGDSFNATDGCNTCSCDHGMVACTEMFCMPNVGYTTCNCDM